MNGILRSILCALLVGTALFPCGTAVAADAYDIIYGGQYYPEEFLLQGHPQFWSKYGIKVQHLSLAKGFHITERIKTTLTGAFSNLFNHPHFSGINTNISNPNPGMFTGTRPNYEPEKQSYRQIDLKLRIEF